MTTLETILDIVSVELPEAGIDCILVGGFAVNYYGYTRNTLDVDFMIFTEQLGRVRQIMARRGFTNITIEDTVAFFSTPESPLRVDFLRVDQNTMQQLSLNAVDAHIFGHRIKVPSLRDLIAMKIFALSRNVARRTAKDLPDITYLSLLNDLDLESDIEPLCVRFGTAEVYDLIRGHLAEMKETP